MWMLDHKNQELWIWSLKWEEVWYDVIIMLLTISWISIKVEEGELYTYQRIKKGSNFVCFGDRETTNMMCIPGRTYETNQRERALCILRCNMNMLSQLWSSFLLSNIIPLKHSSDFNMPRCLLFSPLWRNMNCMLPLWSLTKFMNLWLKSLPKALTKVRCSTFLR